MRLLVIIVVFPLQSHEKMFVEERVACDIPVWQAAPLPTSGPAGSS